jgi:uncharacterized protein
VAAVVAVTLVVGAATQGLVGLGLGLVAAPVTAMLEPRLMPDLLLWLAMVMPMLTLVREHHQIDWRGLAWAVPTRVPGTAVGVLFVGWFSAREMGIAVGLMVLVSVLLTAGAVRFPVNRVTLVLAGFVSGIAGTATSIGGPPMAILYQHRAAQQTSQVLAVSSSLADVVVPGGVFVVVGAGFEAAVEDADESVGELSHCGVVTDAAFAECLVVGAGAG